MDAVVQDTEEQKVGRIGVNGGYEQTESGELSEEWEELDVNGGYEQTESRELSEERRNGRTWMQL